MTDLKALVDSRTPILTDGAVQTRVVFELGIPLDEDVALARLLGRARETRLIRDFFASYARIARAHDLPLVVGTPTFRASLDRVQRAGLGGEEAVRWLNMAGACLLHDVRHRVGHGPVYIAGLLGPRHDAYQVEPGVTVTEAREYHRNQAEALAQGGVDLLMAPTFPSLDEAVGVAQAMAATGLPYVIGFVLAPCGHLLDGTPLEDCVARLDDQASPPPLHYALTCVHSSVARRALAGLSPARLDRVRELKANASALPPEALVALDRVDGDDAETFAQQALEVGREFGLHILGGCCGTSDRHLAALAARIRASAQA